MLTTILIALSAFLLGLCVGHGISTRRVARERKDQESHDRSPARCGTPYLVTREIEDFEREHGSIEDFLSRNRPRKSP